MFSMTHKGSWRSIEDCHVCRGEGDPRQSLLEDFFRLSVSVGSCPLGEEDLFRGYEPGFHEPNCYFYSGSCEPSLD